MFFATVAVAALAALAAAGEPISDIAVVDCNGGGVLLPGTPFEARVNAAALRDAADTAINKLFERSQLRCPEISRDEFNRRFLPYLDGFSTLHVMTNNPYSMPESVCDEDAFFSWVRTDWFTFESLPCTYEEYQAGEPCLFEVALRNSDGDSAGLNVQLAIADCPDSMFPFVSVSCGGDNCPHLGQPCAADSDCGTMTCTDLHAGSDNFWDDMVSVFQSLYWYGSDMDASSCGGVEDQFQSFADYLLNYWSPGASLSMSRMAVCLPESIDADLSVERTKLPLADLPGGGMYDIPYFNDFINVEGLDVDGDGDLFKQYNNLKLNGTATVSGSFDEFQPYRIHFDNGLSVQMDTDFGEGFKFRLMGPSAADGTLVPVIEAVITEIEYYDWMPTIQFGDVEVVAWFTDFQFDFDWTNQKITYYYARDSVELDFLNEVTGLSGFEIESNLAPNLDYTYWSLYSFFACRSACKKWGEFQYEYVINEEGEEETRFAAVSRYDVTSADVQAWDGILDSGESAISGRRLSGSAYPMPETLISEGTTASGVKQEMLVHSCDNRLSLGFHSSMSVTLQIPELNEHIEFFSGWLQSLIECQTDESFLQTLSNEQFGVRYRFWQMPNILYQAAVEHSFVLGTPALKDYLFFDDSVDRMHMPETCSFAQVLSGGECGMNFWAFTELLGLDTEVIMHEGPCESHPNGLPNFALELHGPVPALINAPTPCSSDNDCETGTVCEDAGELFGTDRYGNEDDPLGNILWDLQSYRSVYSEGASSTEHFKTDLRYFIDDITTTASPSGSSELKFCFLDIEYISDNVDSWAEDRVEAEGDTFTLRGLDNYDGPYLSDLVGDSGDDDDDSSGGDDDDSAGDDDDDSAGGDDDDSTGDDDDDDSLSPAAGLAPMMAAIAVVVVGILL